MDINVKKYELNNAQKSIIDFWRIIAMVFVVLGHLFAYYKITIFKDQTYFPYLQNFGVVIFFLISGFLNSYSLETRHYENPMFRSFVVHKIFRIHIELILALVFITVIDFSSIKIDPSKYVYYDAFNLKNFISNTLLIHNSSINSIFHIFAPFGSARPLWMLSVEWWLYMIHGYAFFLSRRKEKRNLLVLLVLMFMPLNSFLFRSERGSVGYIYVLGIVSYYLLGYFKKSNCLLCLALLITYILYGVVFKNAYSIVSYIILSAAFIELMQFASQINIVNRINIFIKISSYSLAVYLIHYSIIDLFHAHVEGLFSIIYSLFITIVISFAIVRLSSIIKRFTREASC